ncbi:hypothetical protein KGM_202690 [Danaus plexippus plexippus]|uniref:Uncharacterized protein n=1 Tax=Danaus plexippus plexippus TaxID=278856 RepID=A0A212ETH8_DANPL|nr:hypothetical protein KGM_202690 [Danaus plexippus plexippus]
MEAKLKEYRALRRRKELLDSAKDKIVKSKDKFINFIIPKIFRDMARKEEEVLLMEDEDELDDKSCLIMEESVSEVSEIESLVEDQESWNHCLLKWSIIAVIWLCFYIIFLKLQFGAVYFVVTILIGIYLNTRTGPRRKGEISAYSVFNKNCKSIDGTLKAEQFENEIRFGAGRVRPF